MVRCHICHIYGIWRSKEVGDALKPPFGMAMQATSGGGDNFNGEGGWRGWGYYVIMLHRNFAVSLTGYLKRSHRIYLLPTFLLFDLFFIYYLDWQRQKCKLKCLKFMRFTLNFIVTLIAALNLFF